MKIYVSSVIDAAPTGVWGHIRNFGNLFWHPEVTACRIEQDQPGDRVGCVRNCSRHDGRRLRHQLLALSDHQFYFTYALLESSPPMAGYIATLKLTPITDDNSAFLEWSAEFEHAPDRETAEHLEDAFQSGLYALKTMMSRSAW